MSAPTNESSEQSSGEKATTMGEFAEEILPRDNQWHRFTIDGHTFEAQYFGELSLDD